MAGEMSSDDFGELRTGEVVRGESGESSASGGATKSFKKIFFLGK